MEAGWALDRQGIPGNAGSVEIQQGIQHRFFSRAFPLPSLIPGHPGVPKGHRTPGRAGNIWKSWEHLEEMGTPGIAGNTWKSWEYMEELGISGRDGNTWNSWEHLEEMGISGIAGNTWRIWARFWWAQPRSPSQEIQGKESSSDPGASAHLGSGLNS